MGNLAGWLQNLLRIAEHPLQARSCEDALAHHGTVVFCGLRLISTCYDCIALSWLAGAHV
jgi:hypothetical protein